MKIKNQRNVYKFKSILVSGVRASFIRKLIVSSKIFQTFWLKLEDSTMSNWNKFRLKKWKTNHFCLLHNDKHASKQHFAGVTFSSTCSLTDIFNFQLRNSVSFHSRFLSRLSRLSNR